MAYFFNTDGFNRFRGSENDYDQVDYAGSLSDYKFILNPNGFVVVTHPVYGRDILHDIDGLWFADEGRWYSIDDAIANSAGVRGYVAADGTIMGNHLHNILSGSDTDNVFYGGFGNDRIFGNGGDYNQVDFDGSLFEYTFSQNSNGTVRVSSAIYGIDRLVDIDGLWFRGEEQWYSVADAIAITADLPRLRVDQDGVIFGTGSRDVMRGNNGDQVFFGGTGNDYYDGRGGFDQVNFYGALEDYTLVLNANGTLNISHTLWGNDRLVDIDGIYFVDEEQWYSVDALIEYLDPTSPAEPDPEPEPEVSTGTLIDGIITGSNAVDDLLLGDEGDNIFFAGQGNDIIRGEGGTDQLNVDGDVIEWTFSISEEGLVIMTHPTWGENILDSVEAILFGRSGEIFTVAQAIEATEDLPEFRLDADNVFNGTNGNDQLIFGAGDQSLYGGVGDDFYDGGDGFDQINYDGLRSEYTITQSANGTITVDHPIWGTDNLVNIEALVFTGFEPGAAGQQVGDFEFILTGDLFA